MSLKRLCSSRYVRVVTLALLLVSAAAPAALADVEPNDNILQAEGPLVNKAYTGALSTDNDEDDYYFYAQPQTQLKVTLTGASDCVRFSLFDENNDKAVVDSVAPDPSTSGLMTYTTPPSVTRLFLDVARRGSYCTPGAYGFTIEGTLPLTTGPALAGPVTSVGEPNENPGQAFGPLVGDQWYSGTIDTSNDEDWSYFYTGAGSHQLDVSAVRLSNCSVGLKIMLGSETVADMGLTYNELAHAQFTSNASARYDVSLTGSCSDSDLGKGAQWRISPAGGLSATFVDPYVAPSISRPKASTVPYVCRQARSITKKVGRRLSAAKRRMSSARSVRAYNRARRQVKLARRSLRRARSHQSRVC